MPYLQVDLDVLEVTPAASSAAGVSAGTFVYGLLQLWRNAWRRKSAEASLPQIAGFFASDDPQRVADALVGFGFLEPGTLRIKGAERYLRISEQRKAAGKLGGIKSQAARKQVLEQPPSKPEASAEQTPKQNEALTSSIEHHSSNNDHRTASSEWGKLPLVDRLREIFREEKHDDYGLSSADELAGRELLRLASGDEKAIERRWRNGLRRTRYPVIASLVELAKPANWNHCATDEAPPGKGKRDFAKGRVGAEEIDWSGKQSEVTDGL